MTERTSLLLLLHRARRGLFAFWFVRTLLHATELLAVGLLVLLLLFALPLGGMAYKITCGFLLTGLIVFHLFRFLVLPLRHAWSPESLAENLEREFSSLRHRLHNALDLQRALHNQTLHGTSSDLAAAAIAQTDELARTTKLPLLFHPPGALKLPALHSLGGAFAVAVLLSLFPQQTQQAVDRLFGDLSQEQFMAGEVRFLAGDLYVTYHYPDYMNLPDQTIAGTSGELEAFPGTVIHLSVRTAEDASEGLILFRDGETVSLAREDVRNFKGTFIASRETRYRFEFDGVKDSRDHRLRLLPDHAPLVKLLYPTQDLDARETDRIELRWQAEDDFGLTRTAFVFNYEKNGQRVDERIPLAGSDSPRRGLDGTYTWDLAAFRFVPGDRVAVFIEATDNDTVSGPKTGKSETRYIKIFSVQEHHQKLIEQQDALFEAMLVVLAHHLENQINREVSLTTAERTRIFYEGSLSQLDGMLLRPVQSLLPQLRDDPLASEAVLAFWEETRAELERQAGGFDQELQYLTRYALRLGTANNWGYSAARRQDGLIAVLEKAITDLKDLLAKQRYDAVLDEAKQLAQMRDDLRRLAEQYKQTGDEALKQQLLQQIQALREKMQEMMAKLAKIKQDVPEEYVNYESFEERGMFDEISRLEEMLKNGETDKLLSELDQLSQNLDEMLKQMEDGASGLGKTMYDEALTKMQQTQEELQTLIHEEERLKEETGQVEEEARQRLGEKQKKEMEKLAKDLQRMAKQAVDEAGKIESDPRDFFDRSYRDQALETLNLMKNALDGSMMQEAKEQAEAAGIPLGKMESMLGQTGRDRTDLKDREHAAKARELAEAIAAEIQKRMPNMEQTLTEKEKESLRQLSQRQQAVGQDAQRLRNKMEEMVRDMPLMPQDAADRMGQARDDMFNSQRNLEGNRPLPAMGQQQQAIHGMQQVREGMQQAMQQMQQGMKPGGRRSGMQRTHRGDGGKDMDKEKTELPTAEQYQAPKELREDLLRAMKEKSPQGYEELNKQFYKDLIQP